LRLIGAGNIYFVMGRSELGKSKGSKKSLKKLFLLRDLIV